MTLTITIEGYGELTNAENSSYWDEEGSGSSPDDDVDNILVGSQSISSKVSGNNKDGWLYYDIVSESKTALDFTPFTGAEAGQQIYIWVSCGTIGKTQPKANTGMAIRIGSGVNASTNTMTFPIGGSDDANGYSGGWKCYVIDPTIVATEVGTFDYADVTFIGFFIATTASVFAAANMYVGAISVGTGVRITGEDVAGWQDVVDYCVDYSTRAWGMVQEREGIYYIYGMLNLGDPAQAAVTIMTDTTNIFKFGNSEYWNGSAWVQSMADGVMGLTIYDNETYATTYTEQGTTFIGSDAATTIFNLFGGFNASSLSNMTGVTWIGIDGGFTWGNDAQHTAISCIWDNCSQIDLVGAVVTEFCTFKNYSLSAAAALLWNSNIDVSNCVFDNNTRAIENAADSPTSSFVNLTFVNNTYDAYYSYGSGIWTINASGTSNPSTKLVDGIGTITINNPKTITLTGLIAGSEIRAYVGIDPDTSVEIDAVESSGTSFVINHEEAGNSGYIIIHSILYEAINIPLIYPSSDTSIPIQQDLDRGYQNL